jgi:hypothetical protein
VHATSERRRSVPHHARSAGDAAEHQILATWPVFVAAQRRSIVVHRPERPAGALRRATIMGTSRTKLVYYKGTWWRTVLLTDGARAVQPLPTDGTRAVQPLPTDGEPADRAMTRYYRRPA